MGIIGLLLLIIIVVVSLLLGLWILLADPRNKINRSFFAVSVCILLWNLFGYLGYRSTLGSEAILFFRINYAAVSLYFIAFYYFTVFFPITIDHRLKYLDKIVVVLGIFFTIVSLFTDLIIKDVTYPAIGKLSLKTGSLGNLFYIFTFILTLYVLFNLIKKYKIISSEQKAKVKYFLVGIITYAFLNVLFNIIVSVSYPDDYKFTQFGDFSAIFFLGFAAYAIMKHQLFNIKVIATEAIVILLSLGLLVEVSLSNGLSEGLIKAIVWILATYGGVQLIKSVRLEIKQKEDLQELTKKLEATNKEVAEANEALKKLDKAKDEFISVASHELNTPLAAIEGYLSMILDEHMAKVDAKATQFLTRAYQSSKRLAALIMDLLNVSRIEQGRIHLQYVETNICDLVDEVVGELKIKADEKKIGIEFACPKDKPPKTWMDGARIHEVITNLTGNAIKFTDKGKVTLTVTADDKNVRVAVKDSGIGIDKEDVEKLFHKFSQVDRMENEHQGTGLGLYISKSYVDMHNGKIWAESEGEGKGTTMLFELPILDKKPLDEHEGEGSVIRSAPDDEVMQQVMAVSKAHEIKE